MLITVEEYVRLGGPGPTILDLLAMPGVGEIELEPPRLICPSNPNRDLDFSTRREFRYARSQFEDCVSALDG